MSTVPLIVRVTVAGAVYGRVTAEPTADEVGLPPVVSIDAEGFVLARLTKLTKVEQETTDDD